MDDREARVLRSSDFVRHIGVSLPRSRLRAEPVSPLPEGSRIWYDAGAAKGRWIYADLRSDLAYTIGDHEPWLQDLLQTELSLGGCYHDVGAHFGFFAMIARVPWDRRA